MGAEMVVHVCNPSTQEAEGGELLWVWGQPGIHMRIKTLHVCGGTGRRREMRLTSEIWEWLKKNQEVVSFWREENDRETGLYLHSISFKLVYFG